MEIEDKFTERVENVKEILSGRGDYGASTDLYYNKDKTVAVIGVQSSCKIYRSNYSFDNIYLMKRSSEAEKLREEIPRELVSATWQEKYGRIFPTNLSEDGSQLDYKVICGEESKYVSIDVNEYYDNLISTKYNDSLNGKTQSEYEGPIRWKHPEIWLTPIEFQED